MTMALFGCSHAYRFEPATNDLTAQLVHRAEVEPRAAASSSYVLRFLTADLYDFDRRCPSDAIEHLGTGGSEYLGRIDHDPSGSESRVTIPAGRFVAVRHVFDGRGVFVRTLCKVGLGFVAEPGAVYTMTFRLGTGECGVDVRDAEGVSVSTATRRGCPALLQATA